MELKQKKKLLTPKTRTSPEVLKSCGKAFEREEPNQSGYVVKLSVENKVRIFDQGERIQGSFLSLKESLGAQKDFFHQEALATIVEPKCADAVGAQCPEIDTLREKKPSSNLSRKT